LSRSLFLGFIVSTLVLAGVAAVRGEFITLALPLAVYLVTGYLISPEATKLSATRHLSTDRTTPHVEVTVTVTIKNHGPHLEEVMIEDHVPADLTIGPAIDASTAIHAAPPNRHLIRLPKDSAYTFTYKVSGPRGGYEFDSVRAKINDPFRVTSRVVELPAKGQLFIFPIVLRLRHVAIHPRRTRVYAGMIPARVGGTGTEFFGVRDYHPGDPPRVINWRASAHHEDVLYANEFQQERVADVGIVLDGRMRTNEFAHGHSLFEHSVQAAAAVADALLAQGNRVGMLVYAAYLRWTIPGYGKIQREKIMHSLAYAKPGGSDVFADLEHLPTRLFPPESQIIMISPLHEDDLMPLVQLRAQGYQVLVISPNPVKFELAYLQKTRNVELAGRVVTMERQLLLQKVRRAGVQVLDWNVLEPFDHVVKRMLSRPPAWLRAVGR
jgi:uncharacterized protein (DUF58 family)